MLVQGKSKGLIVADAGPLIALAIAKLLPQTLSHFGSLLVPASVVAECLADLENPGAERRLAGSFNPGRKHSSHGYGWTRDEVAYLRRPRDDGRH